MFYGWSFIRRYFSGVKRSGTHASRRSPGWFQAPAEVRLTDFTAVVERDSATGLLVGHGPGFPGANSQAEFLAELNANLSDVISMLLKDGEPALEAEFVGTQNVAIS